MVKGIAKTYTLLVSFLIHTGEEIFSLKTKHIWPRDILGIILELNPIVYTSGILRGCQLQRTLFHVNLVCQRKMEESTWGAFCPPLLQPHLIAVWIVQFAAAHRLKTFFFDFLSSNHLFCFIHLCRNYLTHLTITLFTGCSRCLFFLNSPPYFARNAIGSGIDKLVFTTAIFQVLSIREFNLPNLTYLHTVSRSDNISCGCIISEN